MDAVGVVADGGEELSGAVDADAGLSDQGGCCFGDELGEVVIEFVDLVGEFLDPSREMRQRAL